MKRSSPGLLLVPAVSLAFIACAADEPTEIQSQSQGIYIKSTNIADPQPYQNDLVASARQYVLARGNELGLSDYTDFQLRHVSHSRTGEQHVRLDQTHRGVRVFGKQVIVHEKGGLLTSMNGHLMAGLDDFDALIQFDDSAAMNLAKGDYASKTNGTQLLEYKRERIEQVVYMKDKQPHMAWHVHFFTEPQAGIDAGRWNYFIDVESGTVLDAFNWLTTVPAQASGPGGNPNVARTWSAELDVVQAGPNYNMDTQTDPDIGLPDVHALSTRDFNNTTNNGPIVTSASLNFADPTVNDGHGFTELVQRYMLEWYGYDSIEDQMPFQVSPNDGYNLNSRIHYSSNTDNAYWDGTQMTYYDGSGQYFYDLTTDIDVVGHEIAHGFTERHSGLIYSAESGGMNEAFSDMAGTMVEFYHEGDTLNPTIPPGADFDIGHDVAVPGGLPWPGDALRFMCNPPQDTNSIDNYGDYAGQDVHYTSGIYNKAFCLLSARLASPNKDDPTATPTLASVRQAGDVMYAANANQWTPSELMASGCDGLVAEATSLGFTAEEQQAIIDSFIDVGVACAGQTPPLQCDALWTTDSGVITSPNFPNNYPNNVNFTDCIQPASGNIPTLTFTDFNTEAGWDYVYVIDGTTGTVLSTNDGTTLPPDATAPIIVVRFTSDGSVTAPGWRATWGTGGGNLPPVADFSYVATDLNVAFTDQSTDPDGTVVSWAWDFGDGASSTVQNPNYTYAAGGTYNVTLTVTDDQGGFDSVSQFIQVVEPNIPPTASFTYVATDLSVVFTDTSSDPDGSIVAWAWDFGDGNTSTVQNPGNIYPAGGTYTVQLTVTDDAGDSGTTTQTITVLDPNVDPTADFTYVADLLDVTFTDASSDPDGALVAWAWDFGDGNTSTTQNPTNTYAAAGTYTVSLTVTDDRGGTASTTQDISVVENGLPAVSFTYVVTDFDVAFTDTSTDADGSIASWAWDFGDGNTDTVQDPNHTYAAAGDYDVTLTVTDDRGDTASATQTVTILEANIMPTADFTYAAADLAVTFTDASSDPDGQIVGWAWNFGDGNTSTLQNPSNVYAAAGSYTVELTVTDDRGDSVSTTQTVTVDDGGTTDPGGCCDANGQRQAPWTVLIVVLGLVLMRRRRQTLAS